jgi:four helix bundle protein
MNTKYDLEERTFKFAKDVRLFVKTLPHTITSHADAKQVIRSSGSIGANYIEANESTGEKDFAYRLRVSRKEAKETIYWLRLICDTHDLPNGDEGMRLVNEANQLRKILSSIINKYESHKMSA